MIKIILFDNSFYELKEGEIITFGNVGVYVWKEKSHNFPPVRFFVYGYVKEVQND